MTLHQVAEHAGVAPDTARRALRNDPSVRPHLRERVKAAAATLDYHPNLIARGLCRNGNNSLAPFAVEFFGHFWHGQLTHSLSRALVGAGFEPVLCHDAGRMLDVCKSFRARGAILAAHAEPALTAELARGRRLVTVGAWHTGIAAADVAFDFDPAYRALIRRLLADGRKRVAIVSEAWVMAREGGWRAKKFPVVLRELKKAGLPLAGGDVFRYPADFGGWLGNKVQGSTGKVQGSSEVEKSKRRNVHLNLESSLLNLEPCSPLDAVLCEDDVTAAQVVAEMARHGLRTPEDALVVGCDANLPLPGAWSVRVDTDVIARMAVELFCKALESEGAVDSVVYKPVVENTQQSTGNVQRSSENKK